MRLGCPTCGTRYEIPDSKAKPGRKVRCSRCATVFEVEAEETAAPEAPEAFHDDGGGRTAFDDLQDATADADEWDGADPFPGDSDAPMGVGPDPFAEPEPAGPPPLPGSTDFGPTASFDPGVGDPGGFDRGELDAGGAGMDAGDPDGFDPSAGIAAPAADEEEDDPFANIDIGAPAEAVPRTPTGVSAIRAQGGVSAQLVEGSAEAELGGWQLRTPDGTIRDFPDLESVRGWLGANPGLEVEISGDGTTWRPPEALLGLDAPAAAPATPRIKPPAPTGTTVALRPGSEKPRPLSEPAGLPWSLAAGIATVALGLSVVVLSQTLGWSDLSGIFPFEAAGLGAIVPLSGEVAGGGEGDETGGSAAELTGEERYRAAIRAAREARTAQRFEAAVLAYRRAIDQRESPEALEGLAETYALLGDTAREDAARDRLKELRQRQAQDPP